MKQSAWLLAALLLLAHGACDAQADQPKAVKVRPGILGARGWYPADAKALAAFVDKQLKAAPAWEGPAPVALIAPHAGYAYSGPVLGKVYRTVKGRRYDRVFIFGVNHRAMVRGVSVPDVTHYETPLGRVPVDTDVTKRLRAAGVLFTTVPAAHAEEHSIEIQLPFLQRTVRDLRIVPMIVNPQPEHLRDVARIVRKEIGPNDLLVASSDNTHYGPNFGYVPFPPDGKAADRLRKLDMGAVEKMLAIDLEGFLEYRRRTGITICGRRTVGLLLALLPEGAHGTLLGYDTSGRQTGSYVNSVSYVGIAFTADLSKAEEELALKIARVSMERFVRTGERFDPEKEGWKIPAALRRKSGAFVTLKIGDGLRGCIGDILPVRPLFRAIAARAISSAAEDPRFRPVTPEELPEITIEISALSVPRPVSDWRAIRIGEHGILLSYDGQRRSVYLPQVAPEQGWTLEETLSHLSVKGGLAADAWRSPKAGFEVFTAQVFKEKTE